MNERPASWKSSPTCVIKCTRSLQQHYYYHIILLLIFSLTLALLWPPYVIGGPLYFCPVVSFFLRSSIFFFSSPNLSGRRLDVCHTSTHGHWPTFLVIIIIANVQCTFSASTLLVEKEEGHLPAITSKSSTNHEELQRSISVKQKLKTALSTHCATLAKSHNQQAAQA